MMRPFKVISCLHYFTLYNVAYDNFMGKKTHRDLKKDLILLIVHFSSTMWDSVAIVFSSVSADGALSLLMLTFPGSWRNKSRNESADVIPEIQATN